MTDDERAVWSKALGGETFGLGHVFIDAPVLYQYTTMQGLLGIVQSKQIWATDMRFLNDVTEANRIWSFVTRRVEHFISSGKVFESVDLPKFVNLLKQASTGVNFVASFSEARDSLGQWRAYAGSNGVCIGFKQRALQTQWVANPKGGEAHWTGMLPYRVKYIPTDTSSLLDEELEKLLSTGGPLHSAVTKALSKEELLVNWIGVLAVSFKHEAFAEEREWRLCYHRHEKPMRHQRFRVSKSMLVPYIAADLNLTLQKAPAVDGSFIEEVIVGPSANMELTAKAVEQFLLAEGHAGVPVRLSGVPYRDW